MLKIIFYILFVSFSFGCKAQSQKEIIDANQELDSNKVILPGKNHPSINILISQIMSMYHFHKVPLNDSLSAIIFKNYLETLDNGKVYFYKADIDSLSKYKLSFDDYLNKGNLKVPYQIYNLFKKRLDERTKVAIKILTNEFDYTVNEEIQIDRKSEPWAESKEELDEIWRKRLKFEALNLKIAKKGWKDISETLTKRYQRFQKLILQYRDEDVFQLYLKAYTSAVDPHTDYFSPKISEDFKINMSQTVEGIGVTLRAVDDYITITDIVPGGPAFKSGKIKLNDKIISVAQGVGGELINVVGWRIDDVASLTRGKKGTTVKIEVQHDKVSITGPTEIIVIERDKVTLEEQVATKKILTIEEEGRNYKIGVITLPTFYLNFEDLQKGIVDYKSTTRDVKKIIAELKEEKVDGILLDLRNNGGGALLEAISLTGLFIKNGPVVQVKNSGEKIDVEQDDDPEIFYDGPLGVMINNFSASASEIFAGAIQDYERGIIIGNNSFGKGTVQNLVDLQKFFPGTSENKGQLKLTIAKFYRVTGNSTQHKGVKPDIEFPSIYKPGEFGESAEEAALPWDKINTTKYEKWGDVDGTLPNLIKKHQERISNDLEFQFLKEDIKQYNEIKNKKTFTLNEAKKIKERDVDEDKNKKREDARNKLTKIEVKEVPTPVVKENDFELKEGAHVIANLISAKAKK